MDRTKEKNRVIQYLNEKGYKPRYDDDGDVVFIRDDTNFWIIFDSEDATLYQLVLPGVDLFKNDTESKEGNKIALQIVRNVKSVKAFLQDDSLLCFAVDMFCVDFETLTSRLDFSMDACSLAVRLYWLERSVTRASSFLNYLSNEKNND